MKRNGQRDHAKNGEGSVTKSVSMPPTLWDRVEKKIDADPEADFSKYVRGLIRADLVKKGRAA